MGYVMDSKGIAGVAEMGWCAPGEGGGEHHKSGRAALLKDQSSARSLCQSSPLARSVIGTQVRGGSAWRLKETP